MFLASFNWLHIGTAHLGPWALVNQTQSVGGNLCFRVVNFHQSRDEMKSTSFSSADVPC